MGVQLAIGALHYAEPAAVLVCFAGLRIRQVWKAATTASPENASRNYKKVFVTRMLAVLVGLLFFLEGVVTAVSQYRASGDFDPPANQFVYLQGSSILWVVIGLGGGREWHAFLFNALAAVLLESSIVILSSRPSVSATMIWILPRILLLWLSIALSLLSRPYQSVVTEEHQSLLGTENTIAEANGTYGTTTPKKPEEDGDDDDWGRNRFIEKKQRERRENSGSWWTYMRAYSVFLPYLIPRKHARTQFCFFVMVLYLLFERASNVLIPRQTGIIADKLANMKGSGNPPYTDVVFWLVLKYLDSRAGLDALDSIARLYFNQFSFFHITTAAFTHILDLSIDFHEDSDSAELMAAVDQGNALSELVDAVFLEGIPCLVDMMIAFSYFAYLFGLYAAFVSAIAAASYVYIDLKFNAFSLPLRKKYIKIARHQRTVNHEAIEGWKTIVYFNQAGHESTRFQNAIKEYQHSAMRYRLFYYMGSAITDLMRQISFAVMAVLVVFMIAHGKLSVGSFVFLLQYWSTLWSPVTRLTYNFRNISQAFIDAERLLVLFQTKPLVADKYHAQSLNITEAKLVFDGVDFAYDKRKAVIKDISFVAKGGSTIALVGETGSGKSTVLKLLHRFYDVSNGTIQIDGQDVRDVTLNSLRDAIGIVPQDPILFNTSIMDNVKYARLDASDEDVFEVCKAAAIHDRILTFPDGYASKVGARGVKLSGGEKQRVAIARCLLKNPKILLLDEASSAIDSETEALIQDSLKKLCKGRTTIAIAHRLSTIVHADQILVMHEGEIVERGTHYELLAKGGRYNRLWNKQIAATVADAQEELIEGLTG